ncbi:MAG: DsbA family protein [Propionibacteriaceae bacterium]|jgi:protein-disulfide isomerase|nr:DsbA family protein [Propionibacteriaceae bacterium]
MASKKTSQQNRRAQLQAQQRAAAARQKRNRLIGVVAAVVVVVAGLVGVIVWQAQPDAPSPTVSASVSDTYTSGTQPASPGATTPAGVFIPPHGTDAMGYIEVKSAAAKPDAIVVGEHTDYQCPGCGGLTRYYGPAYEQLVERGDVILQIHIRSFLDNNLKNDSSSRAAYASTCADVVGRFAAYHQTVYNHQPEQEGAGYTDQQLRIDFAAEAGITGADLTTFQQCYDSRQTKAYVQQMERVNSTSRTINGPDQAPPSGTPAIYVNGTALMARDLSTAVPPDETVDPLTVSAVNADDLLAYLKSYAAKSQ